jgi:hypothetical protein
LQQDSENDALSLLGKPMLRFSDLVRTNMKKTYPNIIAAIGVCAAILAHAPAVNAAPSLGSATSSDGKTRVDIVSLKRTEGDTVTLRFQVTNGGNDSFSMTTGNAKLIDMVGRRIYSPGLTSSTCSTPSGEQLACYAVFGAPPAGTQKMSVQFYEKLDLISGVPISEQ